ncbi:MAG: cation diffusion facilitator family transporter [Vicinamibacterales bacterium]
MSSLSHRADRGVRFAQLGLVVNAGLAIVKLVAGLVGNSYALVADAVESTADIFSSLIVWGGLRVSTRDADEQYPFGYGKAEPMAAVVVGVMLVGAALGIAAEAIVEIRTPHHAPAPFTLGVLLAVVLTKELLFRRVFEAGTEVSSAAVKADAWHHRSDAITSLAAAVGIGVALAGGAGYEAADDWAALAASGIILVNGAVILRRSIGDLMDRAPDADVSEAIARAATSTPEVRAIEKLRIRRSGLSLFVDVHVQADPAMSLHDAHVLGGRVKSAIVASTPQVAGVLVHMEPFEPPPR